LIGTVEGFARLRCPTCAHEMFVAYSCKQRCACPSCHQKRALLTALHATEEVCATIAHRQLVFTIPKRLRLHARFDRKLLGALALAAWGCVRSQTGRILGRDDVIPHPFRFRLIAVPALLPTLNIALPTSRSPPWRRPTDSAKVEQRDARIVAVEALSAKLKAKVDAELEEESRDHSVTEGGRRRGHGLAPSAIPSGIQVRLDGEKRQCKIVL
jgi:hypothetical protein